MAAFEDGMMKRRALLLTILWVATLYGCQRASSRPGAVAKPTKEGTKQPIVHEKQLHGYLRDEGILRMLGVKELVILEAMVDRVMVGDKASGKKVGEVYYTVQDGWHLTRPNERMAHKPGEGWLIWEE
jgi:hypothetical protein